MFGGVNKGEYEAVVKANNELRAKMEKLRLENALLKDQIRALNTLPPELCALYMFLHPRTKTAIADIKADPKFASVDEAEIKAKLEQMISLGVVETTEKDWNVYYSVKTADFSEAYVPKEKAAVLQQKVSMEFAPHKNLQDGSLEKP
jgi:hypothetical protein